MAEQEQIPFAVARPQYPSAPQEMSDLTTLTVWLIICAFVSYPLTCAGQLAMQITKPFERAESIEASRALLIALGLSSCGVLCIGCVAGIAAAVLWFIWFYKSAKNLRFLPEGGYPYSAGLTLGLAFIPIFNIFWAWRVFTREADALVQAKAARNVQAGKLLLVRPLMVGYLIGVVLSLAATIGWLAFFFSIAFSQPTGGPPDFEELMASWHPLALTFSIGIFLINIVIMLCQYVSVWYITAAMRDIKRSG